MNILPALIPLYIATSLIINLYQFWSIGRLPSEGENLIKYLSRGYLQFKTFKCVIGVLFSLAVILFVPCPTILIAAIGLYGYFIMELIGEATAIMSFSFLLWVGIFPWKMAHTPTTVNVAWVSTCA